MSFNSSTTPVSAASSPIGSCSGATPAPKQFLQLVEGARERRALAVELVDEDRARDAALLGELPRDLGLHLDAFDRGHDEQREVGGLQRGGDVADEVRVARCVEHVHLVAVELERRERERHRDARAAAPRGRSRRQWCRPRPCPCGSSLRWRRGGPRPARSSRRRRARRGRRCGSWPSGRSSPTTPRGKKCVRSEGGV